MSFFIKVLPRPLKCVAKLLRRSVENHLVRYSLKKMAGKQSGRGGKVFIEPLGKVEIFQGSMENPLRVLGTGEGYFKTLKEYCENFFGRVCIKPLKCFQGLFEWGVKKG
jgi:hypothetical protein